MKNSPIEQHPLRPFLPPSGRLLMLGSFPPQHKRWCMEFYYPNYLNDMWRIFGLVFFDDALHFVDTEAKTYRLDDIVSFLNDKGIGIYDTASAVRRLQDNASDRFLEVVVPTDVELLLGQMPHCRAIVTTGQKATDTLCALFSVCQPAVGSYVEFSLHGQPFRLYRMPSSSRAYPLSLQKKSAFYRCMFQDLSML